ncbi:MAG: AraC family transcriptional regulator [Anaerolineae bacterium]
MDRVPELNDLIADSRLENGDINLPAAQRGSDSPLVELVWHSHSAQGGAFTSVANSHSEIVISKFQHDTIVTVRGPETRATAAFAPPDAEFFGIIFKLGAFMPKFPPGMVMDRRDVNLPQAGGRSFWLDSSAWEFPSFENADSFVQRLVRAELLVYDPLVVGVLREQPHALPPISRRTLQRRFLQATGLTYNGIAQIQRARYATDLLKQRVPILDTVELAGYADQPHLTRALRHFMGNTPRQIIRRDTDQPMSFLFKTPRD